MRESAWRESGTDSKRVVIADEARTLHVHEDCFGAALKGTSYHGSRLNNVQMYHIWKVARLALSKLPSILRI